MAEHIRNGNFDRDAVAHVFEITGSFPNFLIAQAIRAGKAFNLNSLAIALEQLGNPAKPVKHVKALPIWMIKAALKYQTGLKLSSALGLGPDYHEDPKWRAYQRFMSAEFRKRSEPDTERKLTRSKLDIDRELNKKWPHRVPGQFPKLEPGQTFSYNSYHVIKAESTATGTFFGTTQTGQPVCVKIPRFEMHPPMLA
jgi:hypothetical protein